LFNHSSGSQQAVFIFQGFVYFSIRRCLMKTKLFVSVLVLVALLFATTAAFAAVTFDPATGTGFVGKGDVQLVYEWNNKALQDNADSVKFRASSEVVTEVSWVCTKDNGNTNERARTTTTTIEGVVSSVARERNQITGFILNGYSGTVEETEETDGPALNSCPDKWELTTPAGDPEVVSSTGGGLEVSIDSVNWKPLTPAE
jgi:hypothetical protein